MPRFEYLVMFFYAISYPDQIEQPAFSILMMQVCTSPHVTLT